jgi:hypothetical protein
MFRLAAVLALAAAPAAATTCAEYEALIYAEGVRTLIAAGCMEEGDALPADWRSVLDTPPIACLMAQTVAGEPHGFALKVYIEEMNRQKAAQGCPPIRPEPTP